MSSGCRIVGKLADFYNYHGRMSAFVKQMNLARYNREDWRLLLSSLEGPPEPKDWLTNYSLRYLGWGTFKK